MEQLAFPFIKNYEPQNIIVQEAPLVVETQNPFAGIFEELWAERRAEARLDEIAYYTAVAEENQLVLDFIDAGLTRRARELAGFVRFLVPFVGI